MLKRIAPAGPQHNRCACGGTLRRVPLTRYQLQDVALDIVLVGKITGYECGACRKVSLPDRLVRRAIDSTTLKLLRLDRRLAGQEAAFLRSATLGYGVTLFAEWRGKSRASIHRYECARSLPVDDDFVLRGLVLGHLIADRTGAGRNLSLALREAECFALGEPRFDPAPERLTPIEIRVR